MKLQTLFQQASAQLDHLDPIAPTVAKRIATLSPKSSRLPHAVIALALVATGLVLLRPHPAPQPLPATFTLTTDSAQLTEHLSTLLDDGSVLVLWSYRGPGLTTDPAPHRAGQYLTRTLRSHPTPDGRTTVCSLLLPDPGVCPALSPPTLSTTSPDHTLLSFTTSPRPTDPSTLRAALQSTGIDPAPLLRQLNEANRLERTP